MKVSCIYLLVQADGRPGGAGKGGSRSDDHLAVPMPRAEADALLVRSPHGEVPAFTLGRRLVRDGFRAGAAATAPTWSTPDELNDVEKLGDTELGDFIVARTKHRGCKMCGCMCRLEVGIEFLRRLVRRMSKHRLRDGEVSRMRIEIEQCADVTEQMNVYVKVETSSDGAGNQAGHHPTPSGFSVRLQKQHVRGLTQQQWSAFDEVEIEQADRWLGQGEAQRLIVLDGVPFHHE